MEPDEQKVDEAVLALMHLTLHDQVRAWKQFPWEATDRLYQRGLISNPVSKTESVVLSEEGLAEADRMFKKLLAKKE